MPILFSVILVSLDSIQIHQKILFDQIGEDDIQINFRKICKIFRTIKMPSIKDFTKVIG